MNPNSELPGTPLVLNAFQTKKALKVIPLAILALVLAFLIFGQHSTAPRKPLIPKINRVPVTVRAVTESHVLRQEVEYPATVHSAQEARVMSKISGTVKELKIKPGDSVKSGDALICIDEATGTSYGTGFSAGSVNQAKLMSEQAATAYQLAQVNYQNMAESVQKDLKQAELSRDQAVTSTSNTRDITSENLKTGQIAYETAKLAAEQARLALENRMESAERTSQDTQTNATITAETAANTLKTIFVGINNLTGFNENNAVDVPYDSYLGFYSQERIDVINLYRTLKPELEEFEDQSFTLLSERISITLKLAGQIKTLVDTVKVLFDQRTVTGSLLPQTSPTGASLSALQSAIVGYQTQINGVISQLNGANQTIENIRLGNESSLDALQKAYELAKQQEKSVAQNLENLKSGTKSQLDQAGFGQDLAENQVENLKIKLDSQLAAAKAQLESARLQYENSLVSLGTLTGNYEPVSPIDGVISTVFVSVGDTVSASQLLAIVSQPDFYRIQFYVDRDAMPLITPGLLIRFTDDAACEQTGTVTEVSTRADDTTRRFMVEAMPENSGINLTFGTVTDVFLTLEKKSDDPTHFFVPLSAITIGQNSNTLYIADEGRAKIVEVAIVKIEGEMAEIAADLKPDSLIVVEGNKRVKEGDYLKMTNVQ